MRLLSGRGAEAESRRDWSKHGNQWSSRGRPVLRRGWDKARRTAHTGRRLWRLAGLSSGFALLVLALFLGGVGAATQHPIGSALVTRAFSGARSLKAFSAYNFAGDVGKVLLPATATSLLLILPWRPAYTLLGLVGVVAAIVIAILTPTITPEPRSASAEACPRRGW